jgi:hypothetical protein
MTPLHWCPYISIDRHQALFQQNNYLGPDSVKQLCSFQVALRFLLTANKATCLNPESCDPCPSIHIEPRLLNRHIRKKRKVKIGPYACNRMDVVRESIKFTIPPCVERHVPYCFTVSTVHIYTTVVSAKSCYYWVIAKSQSKMATMVNI